MSRRLLKEDVQFQYTYITYINYFIDEDIAILKKYSIYQCAMNN